jgi:hypothetical protein
MITVLLREQQYCRYDRRSSMSAVKITVNVCASAKSFRYAASPTSHRMPPSPN